MPGFPSMGLKEVVAAGCWYLWWIRRKRTHGESVPPMVRWKMSILAMVANAKKVQNSGAVIGSDQWVKPPPRHHKLNVDAAFHVDSSTGSIGAIIRDYQGGLIAATGAFIPHVSSAVMAEGKGMQHGFEVGGRLRLN